MKNIFKKMILCAGIVATAKYGLGLILPLLYFGMFDFS